MTEPVGDLHIDDFCKDTAKILRLLYRRFPVRTTLYVEDISGPDQPDEFGLHSPRFQACFGAIIWLKEYDYIHYTSLIRQEAADEVCLTHRSFSLLSSFETHTDQAHTLRRRIDVLSETLASGSSEALKNQMLSLMAASREFT